jgi:hypothetical protein
MDWTIAFADGSLRAFFQKEIKCRRRPVRQPKAIFWRRPRIWNEPVSHDNNSPAGGAGFGPGRPREFC